MPDLPAPRSRFRRLSIIFGAVAVGTVVGFIAVDGATSLMQPKPEAGVCHAAVAQAKRLAPLVHGEVAAVTLATKPLQLPDLAFKDADGNPKKLSDWRGKTVLVNLWATWCVPCRKEMPALDNLEAKLGSDKFQVVAINIDTRDAAKPVAFLKEGDLNKLAYFHDSNAKVFQDLKSVGRALGMPTSVLVDPQGCEIATLSGPAEWDSEDAIKLIEAAVKPAASAGL